ncbi:hypothetical protein LEMLEM_LOCUS7318, partial [Lemmus lemmus]
APPKLKNKIKPEQNKTRKQKQEQNSSFLLLSCLSSTSSFVLVALGAVYNMIYAFVQSALLANVHRNKSQVWLLWNLTNRISMTPVVPVHPRGVLHLSLESNRDSPYSVALPRFNTNG